MSNEQMDFTCSTPVPQEKGVSQLPGKTFGPKADWPNATETPTTSKENRDGTGNSWFNESRGGIDWPNATSVPMESGKTVSRVRPKSWPDAFNKV